MSKKKTVIFKVITKKNELKFYETYEENEEEYRRELFEKHDAIVITTFR